MKPIDPTTSTLPAKHLEVDDIVTAFGRDAKISSLQRRNVVKGLSLSSKLRMPTASMDFDQQSVSTLSGSGMDFFRKFVQRKGRFVLLILTRVWVLRTPNSCRSMLLQGFSCQKAEKRKKKQKY